MKLTLLEATPFNVIVTDMRMPGMDGASPLEIVREKYPSMLRISLSGYTELQASLRAVPVVHQFLLKPCDPEILRAGIARATSLCEAIDSKMLTSLVGAYLLSLWGLPYTVVEAVAHHQHTGRVPNSSLDMVLVVYVPIFLLLNGNPLPGVWWLPCSIWNCSSGQVWLENWPIGAKLPKWPIANTFF